MEKYRRQYFGRRKTWERRNQANGVQKAKRGGPTRPSTVAAWDPPFWPSWLFCRRSFVHRLRLDLKTSIKIVPRGVSRGGGGETQNQETGDRRLPPEKIGGGKRRRNHLRKAPPSPFRSLHQHHRQDQHHLHHHLRDPLHPPRSLRVAIP